MSLKLGKVKTASSHAVHEARSADDFRMRFAKHCGREFEEVLAEVIDPRHVIALVLGGSIPLGIGSGASDLDFLLVIDSEEALDNPLLGKDVLFAFDDLASGTQSRLAKYGLLIEGLKADFMFIDIARLDALIARTTGPRPNLNPGEIALLSRLKVGWDLRPVAPRYEEALSRFRTDRSLEVQIVVRHLRNALNDLEHARLATAESRELAAYLARKAVDQCFQALFARSGIAAVGSKWIRLAWRHPESLSDAPAVAETIRANGLELLFCPLPPPERLDGLIDSTARFYTLVRNDIERDLAMKIATSLCRQIYNPELKTGGLG